MIKKKEKIIHEADGIIFDSREEMEFYWWLLVVKHKQAVADFQYHPQSIELAPKQTYQVEVQNRRGVKTVEKHLLNNCEYTPDFMIVPGVGWNMIKSGWRPDRFGNYWVDVKGYFSIHNDAKYFSAIQKWLYANTGIYCNKVIPEDLFRKTFVPRKAAFNQNGTRRKCYHDCQFYKEFSQTQIQLIQG